MADEAELSNNFDAVQLNGDGEQKQQQQQQNGLSEDYVGKWGFPLSELYKLALLFYKEKEGKAVHLSYKDKLKLVAYTKQVAHGKYRTDVSPEVGFLDVVGNDRRQAWQSLGDMSRESAMAEFIKILDGLCPLLKPFIQAHRTEKEEKIRKEQEEMERKRKHEEDVQLQRLEEEARQQQVLEQQRQLEQERQIRAALNQQTAIQFRQYAEQQFPENTQQQDELINQLQEQHFQQYMQQVYQQQLLHQQQQIQAMSAHQKSVTSNQQGLGQEVTKPETKCDQTNAASRSPDIDGEAETNGDINELPPIAAASMWTRKDFKEFKDSLRNEKDSVIKVGSGETVTVRVPTHEDGTCLFWEFSTDYYDIGFGVYFEWTIAPTSTVSVHISDSSDEELEDDEENKADVEKGRKKDDRPPTDEIIPVYRRDCHEEVYCGSHTYPGRGVYLLKFDNSYSLWRSKTLYYRVYYTR